MTNQQQKTILIVEDDNFLANAYRVKLSKEGYTVEIATNGKSAIDYLKGNIPDLIILDLIMPEVDGFAVLEAKKAIPSVAKVPIIIASNLGQKEDIDKGMGLGAVDYIIKSDISMREIVEKIKKHLQ